MYRNLLSLVIIVFSSFYMVSCVSSKEIVLLNNLSDTSKAELSNARTNFEAPIQKNDILSIAIGGSNPDDLIILNSGSGVIPGAATAGNAKSIGYLVEADGKIQLPFLGRIQAEGLTRLQLQDTLTQMLKDYTKNPVVNVKFLNYEYSVLGEVNHPGQFDMNNERTTILEAIAMANDLTIFGKRNNVLVIREVNGKREFGRVNLLSKDIFKSPYYYLKTNDVVYVEPVKSKFFTRSGAPQYISIAAGGIGLILAILTLSKL
ncbi:MAG TPA: polysaccharide biosynthesis/export family protein [Hanamia sp.]